MQSAPNRSPLSEPLLVCLAGWSCLSFAVFGLFTVASNLYLMCVGCDAAFIATFQGTSRLGAVAGAIVGGWLGRHLGSSRAIAAGLWMTSAGFLLLPTAELADGSLRAGFLLAWGTALHAGMLIFIVNKGPFAMSATASPGEQQRFFVAEHAVMSLFGFLGSLLAGAIPAALEPLGVEAGDPGGYRALFWLSSAVVAAGAWRFQRRAMEARRKPARPTSWRQAPLGTMSAIVAATSLCLLGQNIVRSFFSFYLAAELEAAPGVIGAVGGAALLAGFAALPVTSRLLERFGRVAVFWMGGLGTVVSVAAFGLAGRLGVASAALLALNFTGAVRGPILQHFVLQTMAPSWRAPLSMLQTLGNWLCPAVGALLAGPAIERGRFALVFLAAAGVSLGGVLWTAKLLERATGQDFDYHDGAVKA